MSAFLTLFDLLGELARRRRQAGERCFAAIGLNHTEARVLTLLRQAGGAAAQDALSNLLSVDRTNAGRALLRLEKAGYILRRKSGEDKRSNLVEMTGKGRKTAAEIARLRREMAESFFGDLGEREAETAARVLRKAMGEERRKDGRHGGPEARSKRRGGVG